MRASISVVCLIALVGLGACESPTTHREPVMQFSDAADAIDIYTQEQVDEITQIRTKRARAIIARDRPIVGTSAGCTAALRRLNKTRRVDGAEAAALWQDIRSCRITLEGADTAETLLDSKPLRASRSFTGALKAYAGALEAVTTAASREDFNQSVNALGAAAVSLARSSAEAAGKTPPETPDIGAFATLIGNVAYYFLENRRAAALHDAAKKAQSWIDDGADAIALALHDYHTERLNQRQSALLDRLDAVEKADGSAYLDAVDAVLAAHSRLVAAMRLDPGAPFRKLPEAHDQLIASLEDPQRYLQPTISATRDLYQSAQDAREALKDDP